MAYDKFLVTFTDGNASLQTNLKPWLIADNAFEQMNNAYVFRGRIRKRFGSYLTGVGSDSALTAQLFSRGAVFLGTTDGSGNISGTVPGSIFKIGQAFSIGDEIFTVSVTGTPGVMLTTGSSTVHTYNTSTGAYVINGAAATTNAYFYPAAPIMGIWVYQQGDINSQPTFAFDTQFAYEYNGFFWARSGTGSTPIWHGTNINFFWANTWQGVNGISVMYVTNFNATVPTPGVNDDPLWSYDGTNWAIFKPYFLPAGGAPSTGPWVASALMIVTFKNRLVLLNTIEQDSGGTTNTQYKNRARFSQYGDPLATNAWYEPNQTDSSGNVASGGGFVDAATEEAIVSSEFIKDRLIVYFERSTWELAYTGNQILPFSWQKINTELGSEGTFSTVPFDREVLTIGNTGVHACNGANVIRIDDKIPQEIFQIQNKNEGVKRVWGIRDYYVETVYWTFPSNTELPSATYPNRVLVYNYKNQSWGINYDSITAFGYFQGQSTQTWATYPYAWESSDDTWQSALLQSQFRQIIGGNAQGWLFIINADVMRNAPVMQISQIASSSPNITLTVVDHTLTIGEYVLIENAQGVTGINNNIYQVVTVVSSSVIRVGPASFTGTYTGGGQLTRVSNYGIKSKQWNPYDTKDRDVYISKINFLVDRTSAGQVTVDYFPSSSELSMVEAATQTNTIMGTNILETSPYATVPFEQFQKRLWHPIYFQVDGECIQIYIYMSDTQIKNPAIALSDFELHGMLLTAMPTTQRMQ